MKTIQEKKIERMDFTMARRPKGNYEAYIGKVSSVKMKSKKKLRT